MDRSSGRTGDRGTLSRCIPPSPRSYIANRLRRVHSDASVIESWLTLVFSLELEEVVVAVVVSAVVVVTAVV